MFKSPASVSYPYPLIKIRSLRCKNGVQKGILRTLPWFSLLGLHWFVQRLQRRRAAEEGAERTSQPFLFPFYFGLSTHPTHLYYAIVLSIKSTFPRAQIISAPIFTNCPLPMKYISNISVCQFRIANGYLIIIIEYSEYLD